MYNDVGNCTPFRNVCNIHTNTLIVADVPLEGQYNFCQVIYMAWRSVYNSMKFVPLAHVISGKGHKY